MLTSALSLFLKRNTSGPRCLDCCSFRQCWCACAVLSVKGEACILLGGESEEVTPQEFICGLGH